MVGKIVGGFNNHAGGLTLYDASKHKVGAIGVSGEMHCTSHVIAWKVRDLLGNGQYKSTNVPFGFSSTHDDKLVEDFDSNIVASNYNASKSGFGYYTCNANPTPAQAAGSIEFNNN